MEGVAVNDLLWTCTVCQSLIADSKGSLGVCTLDVRRAKKDKARAEEWLKAKECPSGILSARDFLDPQANWQRAMWGSFHYECDSHDCGACYWFDVERCRFWAELVDWTAHLMGKPWLPLTNWDDLIRGLAHRYGAYNGGLVYFVQSGEDGPVKIGHTKVDRLHLRLSELQTGSHEKLRLLGTIPGDKKKEAELHRRFSSERLNGEWFRPINELLSAARAAR